MKPIPRKAAAGPKTGRGPATILVPHRPNLNLLGTREPGVYGRDTLPDVNPHEPFRHRSYFSDKALGKIVGLGPRVCGFALAYAANRLEG